MRKNPKRKVMMRKHQRKSRKEMNCMKVHNTAWKERKWNSKKMNPKMMKRRWCA